MKASGIFLASLVSAVMASPIANLAQQCSGQAVNGATTQPSDPSARMWLALHNAHRANHTQTCSVAWDQQLANEAMASAQACQFQHTNSGKDYGQNMGETSQGSSEHAVTAMFYNEISEFGPYWHQPNVPIGNPMILHFTQAVWKKTTTIGCATWNCGQWLLSYCNYRGPGNYAGEYGDNVADLIPNPLPPICSEIGSSAQDGSCITDQQLLQYF
ncbi:Allergen V5/Tpx-1-related protein [Lasiodiplodia theobromae]|uniref:Allergen V5/Tpx-1-related protein n=1 Tax=Lasiodiplodia theobromae TaxID=45133 RepID=UPI0015C39560|nr:Allergen V5/Tpx-1-related protein [Lasiodiplodia theobromae]KAF4546562.1 Allergen V5/Tpx-1-related protein [Lasiodiplodia theobromae]